MTYSEKRKLYELIIWTIARIVKSSITQLDDKHLNESIININDISQQFIDAINCVLTEKLSNGYWTYEKVKEIALNYNSLKDWKNSDIEEHRKAYITAQKRTLIDDKGNKVYWINTFDWFSGRNWTYEKCERISRKYDYLNDWKHTTDKNDYNAYLAAVNNFKEDENGNKIRWIDDFYWLKRQRYPNGYWTKERCIAAANECETLRLFTENYPGALNAIKKDYGKDFYKEITAHFKKLNGHLEDYSDDTYIIYVYKVEKYHAAYVGLTKVREINNRDRAHHTKKEDTLVRYCQENNVKIPDMKELLSGLTAEEASAAEVDTYYKYKKDGWNMINGEANLGQLGGYLRIWTKRRCWNIARSYDTLYDLNHNAPSGAIAAMNKYNWKKDYTWLKRIRNENGIYKNSLNIYNDAIRCFSKAYMTKKYPNISHYLHNELFKYTYWFKRTSGIHSENKSKYLNRYFMYYDNIDDMKKWSPRLYNYIEQNNLISKLPWLTDETYWDDKKRCKSEAEKYDNLIDFSHNSFLAWSHAALNNWLEDFFPNDPNLKIHQEIDKLKEE